MKKEPYPASPILILDDDLPVRERVEAILRGAGIDHLVSTSATEEAEAILRDGGASLVLLDLVLDPGGGEALVARLAERSPELPLIVITEAADAQTIVRCMRSGAVDYLVKPVDEGRLLVSVWNALSGVELRREMEAFRDQVLRGGLARPSAFRAIVTEDERMLSLFAYAQSVARSRQPVLVTGETGTGKELFARAIHEASGREGSFVAVNVGGLDDEMFSDTLFGHRKGAYTGAESPRAGLLREAEGGTILLDEIGELEPRSQVKLLRLLQEGEFYPLGSDSPLRSEARIIAATTQDLLAAARRGDFRLDLYYRLHIHPIVLPPLRERRGDLSRLVAHFVAKSTTSLGLPPKTCGPEALELLLAYDYPGNVRELEAVVHDAVASAAGDEISAAAIRDRLGGPGRGGPLGAAAGPTPAEPRFAPEAPAAAAPLPLDLSAERLPTFREAEAILSRAALDRSGGNVSLAATLLGVSRQTLYRKLHEIGAL